MKFSLRQTSSFRLFLHDGHGRLLLFFFLHNRRSFESEQMVAGLPFPHPKDQAYLHLMARLCSMTAWNGLIFRDGLISPGLSRSKDSFSFPGHCLKWLKKTGWL